MKIYQLTPALVPGDATGNDLMALRKKLSSMGLSSEVYVLAMSDRMPKGSAGLFDKMPEPQPEDIVIYHFCIGSRMTEKVMSYRCRKIMIYHNVTPPAFLEPYAPAIAEKCREGLRQMESLKDTFNYVLADSEFNRQDLLRAGYTCPIDVLPILVPFEDYRQQPDPEILEKYSDGMTNILFVGRVAPNKKHENIIRAFDCYQKNFNPNSRLILVGNDGGMEAYKARLLQYISILGTKNVLFPGHISFPQILGFYRAADVFLCMSEHEGFCVPLIESMLFDLPIVALDACAVPYTLGNAGIHLKDTSPEVAAAAIHRLTTDQKLKEALIKNQRAQLESFSYDCVSRLFEEYLNDFLKK